MFMLLHSTVASLSEHPYAILQAEEKTLPRLGPWSSDKRLYPFSPVEVPSPSVIPSVYEKSLGWGTVFATASESRHLEQELLPYMGLAQKTTLSIGEPVHATLPTMLFRQFHSNVVYVVEDQKNLTYPIDHHAAYFPKADGMITTTGNIAFVIRTADCIPLLFTHKKGFVWGGLHVSWRSLKAGILERSFLSLMPLLEKKPKLLLKDFTFILGPSILQCCYPVREDLIQTLAPVLRAYDISFDKVYRVASNTKQFHLDLPALCRAMLINMGASPRNISSSHQCTACDDSVFFSHRAQKTSYRNWNIVFRLM